MSEPILSVEGLGKCYRLGQRAPGSQTFRDTLVNMARAPFQRLRRMTDSTPREGDFWALRDVSFEVQPGEVVGLIGRNGAGKSTLLKILSRIVHPTTGRARMRGRVASLLEVGTGFHSELTGRENIFLNGSFLGMRRSEILRKFDEIVAFAEVDKFLDTPVKFYSSGMYVRLAFAVAAHLDPDILIIDEVLAVGDVEFKKKCMGKMQQVADGEGRTVLFVSHDMPAVRSLCQTCCLLEHGTLVMRGPAGEGVDRYLRQYNEAAAHARVHFERPSKSPLWMKSATVLCDNQPSTSLMMGSPLSITVDFESETPIQSPRLGMVITTAEGHKLINASSRYLPPPQFGSRVTSGTIRCDLGVVPFTGNRYFVNLYLGDQVIDHHIVENALAVDVVEQDLWGTGKVPPASVSSFWWQTRYSLSAGASAKSKESVPTQAA